MTDLFFHHVRKVFLVDVGYAAKPGFLPAFRGTRYHLIEFGTKMPQKPRELFNLKHSSLRVTVERAFCFPIPFSIDYDCGCIQLGPWISMFPRLRLPRRVTYVGVHLGCSGMPLGFGLCYATLLT